jgi:hypothetical protein
MTFELFKVVISYVFENIKENNESLSINIYLKDLSHKHFISYLESIEEKYQIDSMDTEAMAEMMGNKR